MIVERLRPTFLYNIADIHVCSSLKVLAFQPGRSLDYCDTLILFLFKSFCCRYSADIIVLFHALVML